MRAVVAVAVRMLDNVLDATVWPLPEQGKEAAAKRRIGLGFTGLGDALLMLGASLRRGRGQADGGGDRARDARCGVPGLGGVGQGEGRVPAVRRRAVSGGAAVCVAPARRPQGKRSGEHGIRNSHLLAIAPTGTISLAFADNASNGIEPAFSWCYTRKKRMADDTRKEYQVEDHAYRLFKHQHGIDDDVTVLPFDATNEQHSREASGWKAMGSGMRCCRRISSRRWRCRRLTTCG